MQNYPLSDDLAILPQNDQAVAAWAVIWDAAAEVAASRVAAWALIRAITQIFIWAAVYINVFIITCGAVLQT